MTTTSPTSRADRAVVTGSSWRGPWAEFTDAAAITVQQLATHFPLDLWLVTRTLAGSQVVIATAGPRSVEVTVGMTAGTRGPAVGPPVTAPEAGSSGSARSPHPQVAIPLVLRDGSVCGWLRGWISSSEAHVGGEVVRWAELVGRTLSTVLDAERTARERERELSLAHALAERDALTGLRNRRGWVNGLALDHWGAASDEPLAVIVVDLDDLKRVNDSWGHAMGDAVLVHCASVLRGACRTSDVLARVGGDEFTVLVRLSATGTAELLRRLQRALTDAGIAASMGAAAQEPGEDLHDTWRRADAAMYRDKRLRKTAAACHPPATTGARPTGSCGGRCATVSHLS